MYSVYISKSDLLTFISNTDIHELNSVWKWISSSNDVMYHVDCIIKCDVTLRKCIYVLKISMAYHLLSLKYR